MKDSIGGSMLLYLVIIFVSIIILMFVGILSYSKAYKIKNRIIEVIEENEKYDSVVAEQLTEDLTRAGYRFANESQINNKCIDGVNLTSTLAGHLYCVYKVEVDPTDMDKGYYYKVTTYVHFDFPVVGSTLIVPVRGETKIIGKKYNY